MDSEIQGKTVLVTGASKGIGAQTARAFARAGANVGLLARTKDEIDTISAEYPKTSLAQVCDVSDYAQVEKAAQTCNERFGGVDILVNNAGVIQPISLLSKSDPKSWGEAIDINLKGVYHGARAVLPIMKNAGGGTILTVSSGAAHGAVEAWSHYCASKAGAAMLTKCIDLEERENGIRAIGLSPGTVATKMQREIKSSGINPVSRIDWADHISADWPAQALLWMSTSAADGYLGHEISLKDDAIRRQIGLIE